MSHRQQVAMDVVTDPRLQQPFPFDGANFAFPPHAGAPGPGGQYDPAALPYGVPTDRRDDEQDAWMNNSGLQSHVNGNHNQVANAHSSPQARLRAARNSQQSPLNGAARPTGQQLRSPQQVPGSRSSGLAFKTSSSNYPQGAAVPSADDTAADNSSIYIPLTQSLNNNVTYFASDGPDPSSSEALVQELVQEAPIDPGSAGPSANPFSDSFPLVTDPPNLHDWRERLFNIEQPVHMSEAQFLTYFPHIDNVYSHRSTQKYKRKPFVSHYWDCRLKGRPSGTKKSDDPNKKKRKREKRERDLCDVKVKITEWFGEEQCREMGIEPEYPTLDGPDNLQIVIESANASASNEANAGGDTNSFGMLEPTKRFPRGHPGADGKKWYTIQRVNGSAHSNAATGIMEDDEAGDGDDKDLDHKHTLEESDRIKKNSVQRFLLKEEKERKAAKKVTLPALSMMIL
jgi:glutathione S-transferase